jgi:putative PIN family toxin of toxin-antitoxin system
VIDTNVLVSGLVWGGRPGDVIELVIAQELEAYASEEMMLEYFRILDKLTKNNKAIIDQWKMLLLDTMTIVETTEAITECRDPKDNMFLECAIASDAEIIISGDADLLAMNPFRKVKIYSVKEFLKWYR